MPARRRSLVASAVVAALLAGSPVLAADPPRLLRQPTLSANAIVFAFAGDLWSVARAGGLARRLTAGPGDESHPRFSPDGRRVAFTGEYDGNLDVYVVDAEGGEPRRLTWHPGADIVLGWSPDGREILFESGRASGTDDHQVFAVPVDGGFPRQLPIPRGVEASLSPDGRRLAYVPFDQWEPGWKHYRGGQTSRVWIVDLATLALTKVPRDNSNDRSPVWLGDAVYFLSDRDGGTALYRYDPATHAVARAFANDGLDLKAIAAGPDAVVFERFGEIGLFDPASGRASAVPIRVEADFPAARPHYEKIAESISAAGLSPSGARAVFEARGDVWTVPGEKGEARNLTRSSGAADRSPAWSPDGKTIAWLSDGDGEYALRLAPQDGLGAPRTIALGDPPSFFYAPVWSPDGKTIALTDKRMKIWTVDVASGAMTLVDQDLYDAPGPWGVLGPTWSPDSRYLAYSRQLENHLHAIFVWSTTEKTSRRISDGMSDAMFPAFDRDGKYLYFTASTDAGASAAWLDLSSVGHPLSRNVYLAVLAKDVPSPLLPESDEETGKDAKGADDKDEAKADAPAKDGKKKGDAAGSGEKAGADAKADAPAPVKIDFDRLATRIVPLPIPAANYAGLAAGKAGEIFLLGWPEVLDADAEEPPSGPLSKFTLKDKKVEKLADEVDEFHLSADGAKLLAHSGEKWILAGTDAALDPGKGALALDGLEAYVDPRAEWRQMYHEAWRIERDFLYDPHAHGLDIPAAEKRYAAYLDGLESRGDLNYLFEEMLANINLGHVFVGGGDLPDAPKVAGGLLGCDFEIADGRYRFARVFDGESWYPKQTAPLAAPGVEVAAGEYLIAIEGHELHPPESPYRWLENTAGKATRIRVARDAAGKQARDLSVVPVPSEHALRYHAWIEDNRRKVAELSGGRLAYLHLPDTAGGAFVNFNRYFFSQVDKQGAIVDERFNHGGDLADYVVDYLRRPTLSLLMSRDGRDSRSPAASIDGPKVLVTNEMSGSGGDALPWYFRKLGIGPLVGTRTWGGLVGIWDYPDLVDGGYVTAPRGGLYGTDGKWEVENRGIAPDLEVEMLPADCKDGRDPQLERAVAVALDLLAKNPPKKYVRPPFPNYQTTPWQSEAQP
jgi:tricorn protease